MLKSFGKPNKCLKFLVAMRSWETPVPIPNTTVKTRSAEDTWLETTRENRWLPDSILLYIKALRASAPLILNSSAVEQPAVNRWVVGSSPTWGVSFRGIVQSVERWSPKPNVEGSSPSAPAMSNRNLVKVAVVFSAPGGRTF